MIEAAVFGTLLFKHVVMKQNSSGAVREKTFFSKTPTLTLYMNRRQSTTYVLVTSDFNKHDLWTRYLSRENFCTKGMFEQFCLFGL